ncbi:MAG TPA: hypothetical protein VLV25_04580 [Steroidobacteraceae bacterium]|nr:hypothetical protein [Steroidobacteraceae bacterium]
MSAAFAGPGLLNGGGTRRAARARAARRGALARFAPWMAPLLTAGLLAGCTYLMFASHGASLI